MNELTKEKQITVFYPELGKNIDCYHTKVVRLAVEELKKRIDNSSIDLGFNLINDLIDVVFSGVKK